MSTAEAKCRMRVTSSDSRQLELLAEIVAPDAGTLPDDLRKSRRVRFPATPTPT